MNLRHVASPPLRSWGASLAGKLWVSSAVVRVEVSLLRFGMAGNGIHICEPEPCSFHGSQAAADVWSIGFGYAPASGRRSQLRRCR